VSDWNTNIIEEFRANEGRVGGPFEGAPMILIHHLGAKSGTERVTPLVYFPQADGHLVIVASKAGAPTKPRLVPQPAGQPAIDVEVGAETFPVTAAEVTGEDARPLWKTIVAATRASASTRRRPPG